MDHYLFLNSKDSLNLYTDNSASNFRVRLPQDLDLSGEWEVALLDFDFPKPSRGTGCMRVCVDFCQESVAGGRTLPVLRSLSEVVHRGRIERPIYIRVTTQRLSELRVYVLGAKQSFVNYPAGSVSNITLHLRQTPLKLCA